MSGVSLTLLLLPSDGEKDAPEASQILSLLDDRSETLGWKWTAQSAPVDISQQTSPVAIAPVKSAQLDTVQVPNPTHVLEKIQAAAKACIAAEPEITRMDTIAGDGDAGLTLKVRRNHRNILLYLIPHIRRLGQKVRTTNSMDQGKTNVEK